jgi:hypothetical protein
MNYQDYFNKPPTENTRVMCMIYGQPVTGKTTGARTFPDPHILDFENNLPKGVGKVIPMWDDSFVDSIKKRVHQSWSANRRDVALMVAKDLATQMPAGSTLIIDSLTRLETWYNIQENEEPPILSEKTKQQDTNAHYRKRLIYFDTFLTMFTTAKCNVVMIVHQQFERDEKREVTQHVRPALMGQIGEKLPGYFPVLLQAVRRQAKPTDPVTFDWRVKSSMFEPARIPKPIAQDFIPQSYTELAKYL